MIARSVVAGTALATAIGLALSASGSNASADAETDRQVLAQSESRTVVQDGDPSLAAEVKAFANRYNVSEERADAALALQAISIEFGAELRNELPDSFAGIWFAEPDLFTMNIGIRASDEDSSNTVLSIAARYGIESAVNIVSTQYSLAQLEGGIESLNEELTKTSQVLDAPAPGIGIRPSENRIVIHLDPTLDSQTNDQLASVPDGLLDRMSSVRYDGSPDREAAGCIHPFCDPPLRSGIGIGSENGDLCSGAFLARSQSDGVLYQLTAGHCSGVNVLWRTREKDGTLRNIGEVHSRDRGTATGDANYGDSAIIRVNSNGFLQARAWVFVTSSPDTTPNTQYPIRAVGRVTNEGVFVCRSGRSLTSCGETTDLSSCYTGSTGVTYCGMVDTNFAAVGGDSGGPVYIRNIALGIVSSTGGRYEPIQRAEARRNVDVSIDQG